MDKAATLASSPTAPLSTAPVASPHAVGFGGWVPGAVMFDLDGTLVDTMGSFADLAAELMAARYEMSYVIARRRYLETSGVPFRQQLEVIFPDDPRNQATSDSYEARKGALCCDARMDDPTRRALHWLRQQGMHVVVSSNAAQHFVDDFADRSGFSFSLVLGFGDGLAKGRPHVEAVQRDLRLGPDQILFVGDSLKDGELARQCGLRFAAHAGTFQPSAFWKKFPGSPVLDRIHDLCTVLNPRV